MAVVITCVTTTYTIQYDSECDYKDDADSYSNGNYDVYVQQNVSGVLGEEGNR